MSRIDPFRTFILCCAIALFGGVSAQQTKHTYMNSFLEECSKAEASYEKQFVAKEGDVYRAELRTMKGKLKMKGSYADPELQVEHGAFEFYHADGALESAGSYEKGYKSGIWRRFNSMGKELAEKVYESELLETIVYSRAEQMPNYPGGEEQLASYLELNLNTPKRKGKKIKATASFIVEQSGLVTDVKVVQSAGAAEDQRIMRALQQMPSWQPGAEKGKTVRVRVIMPITL